MNKTNQAIIEEFKNRFSENGYEKDGDKHSFPYFDGSSLKKEISYFLLKALEAKDTEAVLAVEIATRNMEEAHRKEMIEVENFIIELKKSKAYTELCYVHSPLGGICKTCNDMHFSKAVDCIEEQLTKLKSND